MTRDEFLRAVQAHGIRSDAFDLSDRGDECYIVVGRQGRWDVYYSERGLESRLRHFSTESAALEHLLDALRADPSAKL